MPVSLYTIEIPAVHAGDQTISSMYDWWFYAERGHGLWPEARPVKGSAQTRIHDRRLPSAYVVDAISFTDTKAWARALHSYVAMHEWKLVVPPADDIYPISPMVHYPLHELVHRVEGCDSGISDTRLLMLVSLEEQNTIGYTRANPFRGVTLAPPR